jgi:hypothetical protein
MLRRNDYTSFMSEEKQAYLEKQLILSNWWKPYWSLNREKNYEKYVIVGKLENVACIEFVENLWYQVQNCMTKMKPCKTYEKWL